MRKAAVSVLVVIMCIFMFTGCGNGKTIEQQISQAQLIKLNEEIKNVPMFSTTFKDAKIEIEGNHVMYKYYYKMDLDEAQFAAVKSSLENSGLDSQVETLKKQFNKDYHVSDSSVSFIYYTNDGRVIAQIEG